MKRKELPALCSWSCNYGDSIRKAPSLCKRPSHAGETIVGVKQMHHSIEIRAITSISGLISKTQIASAASTLFGYLSPPRSDSRVTCRSKREYSAICLPRSAFISCNMTGNSWIPGKVNVKSMREARACFRCQVLARLSASQQQRYGQSCLDTCVFVP